MVWDTYVPALVCALLLLVVNGATSNPLLADLVEPDLKPPTCLTNPNKYGWEGFQNFTRAKRPIIIEQAGWDSARIASRIMQIMLSEVMGFRVKYQEFQGGVAATVPRLKAQNVVDVAMELWATPDGAWQNFGSLGYQGRSGLYVPSSLVDAYPELSIDFWRFMQSPIARNLFVKSGEGPEIRTADGGYVCDNVLRGCQKGRYFPSWYKESEANNFIEIWSPFPGWSKWRYERLIDGLKLNATIRWLGNDHDNIVAAYLKNNSAPGIIFYSWIPTAFVASNNATRLMLPFDSSGAFTKHNKDPQNNVLLVDEPQFSLLKAGTLKFPQEFPDAAEFLSKFEIQDDEINLILLDIANNISYTNSACDWLRKNEARWSSWIPPPPTTYEKCPFGTGRYLSDGLGLCLTCPSESFSWKHNNSGPCSQCPLEGICPGGDVVNVQKGYFLADPRVTNKSTPEFYSCPDREACCPTGNCTISSNCDIGFTGVLCTECIDPTTSKWRGKCISCEKTGASLYLLFVLSFVSTFVVLFIPRHELPTVDLLFFFFQVIQLIFGPSIDELLGFGQLKTFLALTSLDMDGIAVDCPVKVSGVGKLLFRFILPLAFFVNVGILYMIFRLLRRSSVPVEKIFPYYMRGQSVEAVFFKALLSISTFALMPLVEASVALLDCRKIMGSFVLYTAPAIQCYKGSHVGPVSFAIFVILLLLVAHPIALVSLLMKMKKENRIIYEENVDLPLKDQLLQNLYLQYKPNFMLMEAYFIIERGLIVIFFTVFPEENRWSAFGYIILFGSIMSVRLYLQPFQDKLEDYLNREISLCWLMLLAFKYTSFGSNDHDIAPYVIAIMFLPPTLHVLRLVISYSSGNSRHIARSKDEIYEAKTTKKGGYDKNDPERVPLSHGNLNEI